MSCDKCGQPIEENEACDCQADIGENQVRVLSEEERYGYEGTTIDASEPHGWQEEQFFRSERKQGKIYYRQFQMGGRKSWISWLIGGVVVTGVVVCVFFLFLPLLLVIGGIAILWYLLRWL